MLRRKNKERKEGGRKEERKGRERNKEDQSINNERKKGKKKRAECDSKEVTFKQKPVWAIKGLGVERGQGV